jgi:Rod binding domain-containing protein
MSNMMIPGLTAAPETAQQNPRLASAAHEFEASLMKEFLQPLQHDSLFTEDGDNDEDGAGGSAGTLMSYSAEMMAKAISEHGGFGIAQEILDHFKSAENPGQGGAESDKVHF